MNDDTEKGGIDQTHTLTLTGNEYALLIEVLATRYADLRADQDQGNEATWLGNMIDELEGLNYKIHFIDGSDIEMFTEDDDDGYDELGMVTL